MATTTSAPEIEAAVEGLALNTERLLLLLRLCSQFQIRTFLQEDLQEGLRGERRCAHRRQTVCCCTKPKGAAEVVPH